MELWQCKLRRFIWNKKYKKKCINDDFEYLCDTKYLELIKISETSGLLNTNGNGDYIIYNNKYKFMFNHESPGHANLYITQNWKNGINHYIMNNYTEFINRYKRRIQNIKNYLSSDKIIRFILTRPNTNINDITLLNNTITRKYPNLKYNFIILDCNKLHFYNHLILMKFNK